jgi:hypothetical protein
VYLNNDAVFEHNPLSSAVAVYLSDARRSFDGLLRAEVLERSAYRRALAEHIGAPVAHLAEPSDLLV